MFSIHNERKPVIAERFIRTLKNKIHKYISINYMILYKNIITHIIEQLKWNMLMLKIIHILILKKKLTVKIQNWIGF